MSNKKINVDPPSSSLLVLGDADATFNEAVIACLAELKLLTAANNDALALTEILLSLQSVCDKLLAQSDQNIELISQLTALCEKIELGNADILTCFSQIKLLLTCKPATPLGVLTTWN